MPQRRAVIDVGTNAVKLLVAEVSGSEINPLFETSEQTRLGSGLYQTHRLQARAIDQTAQAVARFAAEASRWGTQRVRVIATSAARDAVNQAELISAVASASGLNVEVISGDQEADWMFRGVASDSALAGRPLLIVDAGGGSTEFVLGEGFHAYFQRSFPLGTVRLLERLKPSDPPTSTDWLNCQAAIHESFAHDLVASIQPHWAALASRSAQVVGTSGTATILAKIEKGISGYERDLIEGTELSRERVHQLRGQLWRLPLAERKRLPGLPPERADVILTGIAIYEAVLEELDLPTLRISTRGLRFAALLESSSEDR